MNQLVVATRNRLADLALQGDTDGARSLVRRLVSDGVSVSEVVEEVLAGAQHEIGERWHENRCSVVDEHVATEVVRTTLEVALATPRQSPAHRGSVAIACAEGDWHGLAARFQAELLREQGWSVRFLGASAPSDQVQSYLARKVPAALVITCSFPLALGGAARLAQSAHAVGVPVLIGGRAVTPLGLARRLGGDGDPTTFEEITRVLESWEQRPPTTFNAPRLWQDAQLTDVEADRIARVAMAVLSCRVSMDSYGERQRARTLEDLTYIVRFASAAVLVDSRDVFVEFQEWLARLLAARGVPGQALSTGVSVLRDVIGDDLAVGDRAEVMKAIATVLDYYV